MKRRSFLGTIGASLAAVSMPNIFRKMPEPLVTASFEDALARLKNEPIFPCVYLYNPGLDIEGVQDLTFHQHSVISGGKVTRVNSSEEWLTKSIEPSVNNSIRKEIIEGPLCAEPRYIVAHHAREIADNLLEVGWRSQHLNGQMLIEIGSWRGHDVELDKLNDFLYAPTLDERKRKLESLPRHWNKIGFLRAELLPVIATYRKDLTELLRRRFQETRFTDTFQRRALELLADPELVKIAKATDRLTRDEKQMIRIRSEVRNRIDNYHGTVENEVAAFRKRVHERLDN